jgi:hypothetical protein
MNDLAEGGANVFQTVQKRTMDQAATAREFGDAMTFMAGVDIQHNLQEADPTGVRSEVRNLIDSFDRLDGGIGITAGNGIVSGTPFENIEAFLDMTARFGIGHRIQWALDITEAKQVMSGDRPYDF